MLAVVVVVGMVVVSIVAIKRDQYSDDYRQASQTQRQGRLERYRPPDWKDDSMEIPVSRKRTCVYCAVFIDGNAPGTWRKATGWLPVARYKHNKGGSNSLTLRTNLEEYACAECIDRLKHGIPVGQMTIFETE